jgi:hypothetical protein
MKIVDFMQGAIGRATRIALGLALIGAGIAIGGVGWILMAIGLVPLAAGAFGVCLVAPLLHEPLRRVRHGRLPT